MAKLTLTLVGFDVSCHEACEDYQSEEKAYLHFKWSQARALHTSRPPLATHTYQSVSLGGSHSNRWSGDLWQPGLSRGSPRRSSLRSRCKSRCQLWAQEKCNEAGLKGPAVHLSPIPTPPTAASPTVHLQERIVLVGGF